MKRPVLPLDVTSRELIDFCLYFRTVEGFIAEYEKNLRLVDRKLKKAGIKTLAYEMTEQYYCQLFNSNRRFADREAFFVVLSRFNTKHGKK